MTDHRSEILDLARQKVPLSPWFAAALDRAIARGDMIAPDRLHAVRDRLVQDLRDYAAATGVGTAVLGMSGGVDSALTAALLKTAGWRVVGHTLPIDQNPEETDRGIEACHALGIEHVNFDLTAEYRMMVAKLAELDPAMADGEDTATRIRRGNIRARLRMITLYDQAARHGGLVASTDNFSELSAGFWTLHGDVGDLAPVQSLLKSWEVPWMARETGVPERTWRATPTDGLGISAGDEAQLGTSYLEWDLVVLEIVELLKSGPVARDQIGARLGLTGDARAVEALKAVTWRLGRTWYKRINPICLEHPHAPRYAMLESVDRALFWPPVIAHDR